MHKSVMEKETRKILIEYHDLIPLNMIKNECWQFISTLLRESDPKSANLQINTKATDLPTKFDKIMILLKGLDETKSPETIDIGFSIAEKLIDQSVYGDLDMQLLEEILTLFPNMILLPIGRMIIIKRLILSNASVNEIVSAAGSDFSVQDAIAISKLMKRKVFISDSIEI